MFYLKSSLKAFHPSASSPSSISTVQLDGGNHISITGGTRSLPCTRGFSKIGLNVARPWRKSRFQTERFGSRNPCSFVPSPPNTGRCRSFGPLSPRSPVNGSTPCYKEWKTHRVWTLYRKTPQDRTAFSLREITWVILQTSRSQPPRTYHQLSLPPIPT